MQRLMLATSLFVALLVSGCSATDNQQTTNSNTNTDNKKLASELSGGYTKPGAPISFSNTYSGITELGKQQHFEVRLTLQVSGELTAQVKSNDGILVNGDIQMTQSVSEGQTVVLPVTVQILSDGKYYLNIHANVSQNGQQQSRAFALALYAGAWKESQDTKRSKQIKEDGGVIIMPATETINDEKEVP